MAGGRAFAQFAVVSELSKKQELEQARQGTHGLERKLLRRGKRGVDPIGLKPTVHCREQAEEWAQKQPWYDRIVLRHCDARWWVWWVKPEGK